MPCGPILYHDLGQTASIILHTKKDPQNPRIDKIFNPEFKLLQGFPAPLYKLLKDEEGIFVAKFKLPHGISACGTYLCLIKWFDVEENIEKKEIYTIVLSNPNNKVNQNSSAVGL